MYLFIYITNTNVILKRIAMIAVMIQNLMIHEWYFYSLAKASIRY